MRLAVFYLFGEREDRDPGGPVRGGRYPGGGQDRNHPLAALDNLRTPAHRLNILKFRILPCFFFLFLSLHLFYLILYSFQLEAKSR